MVNLVLAVLMTGQSEPTLTERHGKSAAEIESMGRAGWYRFYTEKEGGETTMSMTFAESYFGWALRTENNRRMNRAGASAETVAFFRANMKEFKHRSIDVGRAYSGGGSMWNTVYAGTEADVEEVVRYWLTGKGDVEGRPADQASVWKALKEGATSLARAREDIEGGEEFSRIRYADVARASRALPGLFSEAVGKMGGISPEVKGEIFGFYRRAAELAIRSEEPVVGTSDRVLVEFPR